MYASHSGILVCFKCRETHDALHLSNCGTDRVHPITAVSSFLLPWNPKYLELGRLPLYLKPLPQTCVLLSRFTTADRFLIEHCFR